MAVMREDFLDPLPTFRRHATLLFGTSPIDCFIVETTKAGFRVAVPNVEQYEGDPRLTIATDKGIFPVRLTHQIRHAGGYSYSLERVEVPVPVVEPVEEPPVTSHWWSSGPFALAVVVLIVTGWLCGPALSDGLCQLRNRNRSADTPGLAELPDKSNNAVPTKVVDPAELGVHGQTIHNVHQSSDGTSPVVAAASMTSAAGGVDAEIPTLQTESRPYQKPKSSSYEQTAALKSYLQAGRAGRIQVIDRLTAPWLLATGNSNFSISIKGSEAALADLNQFQAGLKELSAEESANAVAKLQRALSLLISDSAVSHRVAEMPDVSAIEAGEANIYFRVVNGKKELVRVLPRELNRADEK